MRHIAPAIFTYFVSPALCNKMVPASKLPWPTTFMPSAIQFIAAWAKSLEDRYPMHNEQTKDSTKKTISPFFFSLAAKMHKTVSIMPSPATISVTNTKVPENTGGTATAASPDGLWRWQISAIMPIPASRNPMDCTGKNMWLSA